MPKSFGYLGVVLLCCSIVRSASADVIIDFVFTDGSDSGGGFFDASTTAGAANTAALTDVAGYLASVLDHTAALKINVSTKTSGSIASGGGFHYIDPLASGVIANAVQDAVLMGGSPPSPTDAHGFIEVNTTKTFYTGADPLGIGAEKDLRSVVLHEMTHVLGWGSFIKADGTSALSDAFKDAAAAGSIDPAFAGVDELYSIYDTFLVDFDDSSPLIDPATEDFVIGSDLTGVLIASPDAVAEAGGLIPTVITPVDFDPTHIPSSLSLDTLMNPGLADGAIKREFTDFDRAVLSDLGYSFKAVPEPSSAVLLCLAGSLACFRRQRCN